MEDVGVTAEIRWTVNDPVLRIAEGETVDADADLILQYREAWGSLGLTVTQAPTDPEATWRVRAEPYVGLARLPRRDGFQPQVQITPKLPADIFFLADYAFELGHGKIRHRQAPTGVAALSHDPAAALIAWFLDEINRFVLSHLRRDYVLEHEVFDGRARGRLLLTDYLERFVASGQSHRAPCQFFDFTQDNPPNQILKRTTRLLAGAAGLLALPAARTELRRRAQRILSYLATVSDARVSAADFNRLRLRGSLSHYAPIIRKCRAFLDGTYLSSEPGTHVQDAFLWSMPSLFQDALHGLLETTPGVTLDAGRATRALRDPGGLVLQRRLVNPDFVLTVAGTRWVLDAKYKDTRLLANGDEAMELEVAPGRRIRINAADIYQITAYGQHEKYVPAQLGLVYPVVLAPGQKLPAPHRITGFAQDVYILFLDVGATARANIPAFRESLGASSTLVAHAA